MYWHETEHLGLDTDGDLYLLGEDRRRLGNIEHAADACFDLGLEAEYDEHLDLWQDSAYDYAGQVRADYYSTRF